MNESLERESYEECNSQYIVESECIGECMSGCPECEAREEWYLEFYEPWNI